MFDPPLHSTLPAFKCFNLSKSIYIFIRIKNNISSLIVKNGPRKYELRNCLVKVSHKIFIVVKIYKSNGNVTLFIANFLNIKNYRI